MSFVILRNPADDNNNNPKMTNDKWKMENGKSALI
jgi:hypothetical protein